MRDDAYAIGIYDDRAQLDHDVAMLLDAILSDLAARDVDRDVALASVRRVLRATS